MDESFWTHYLAYCRNQEYSLRKTGSSVTLSLGVCLVYLHHPSGHGLLGNAEEQCEFYFFIEIFHIGRFIHCFQVKLMRLAYYGQFFSGVLPLCIGLGSQFPELIEYIRDPSRTDIPTVKGSFPMVVIWFIFFLIAFQLHIFAMYFEYYLLAAWDPVVEKSDDAVEDSTENEKNQKEETTPTTRSALNRKARKAD